VARTIPIGAILLTWSCGLLAQEKPLIEEIIVAAQRIEERASKVPIAISAYDETMIRDRQIIGLSDLQINVPNFAYVPLPAGGAQLTLRGIGVLLSADDRAAAGPSAPLHIHGLISPVEVGVIEFFDLERVEVLRGPQGTLYGRNATAGAINIVPKRPDLEGSGGYIDVEYGNYDHTRLTGALNLAGGGKFGVRFAGMSLDRDGYIKNRAAAQIPGIKRDMDDRDLHAYRLTAEWQPADDFTLWAMYGRFQENDAQIRNTNVICQQSDLPALGCDPESFGRDAPNPGAIIGTVIAAGTGAATPSSSFQYEFPRPTLGLREQHSDFNPVFEFKENVWMGGLHWQSDTMNLEIIGGYFENFSLRQQDFSNDVGNLLNPTPQNASGLWPTSAPSGPVGALRDGGSCDLESGRAGVAGGCTFGAPLNRSFAYDQVSGESEAWSIETRIRSDFDGRWNFLLGFNYLDQEREGEFGTYGNLLDAANLVGLPPFGQLYPSFIHIGNQSKSENFAAFGELYVNLTERVKLTAGLRYSHDRSDNELAATLFSSTNVGPFFGSAEPLWIRAEMLGYLTPAGPGDAALTLAEFYGATEAIDAATNAAELLAALKIVPVAPRFGEREAFGFPSSSSWNDVSGRVGLDWSLSDDALLYLFFSQAYRPGGLNAAVDNPKYDSEQVNSIELGAKTKWASGSLSLNGAFFFNDHKDLQVTRVGAATSDVTDNIDAQTLGFELEAIWRPIWDPRLSVELGYAWLHTEVNNDEAIDPLDRTRSNPDLVNLKDITGFGAGYTAAADEVLPWVQAAVDGGFADPDWGSYENGVPVYFSRAFLDAVGVPTSLGIAADLHGNHLSNAPPHAVRLGLSHTWSFARTTLTARYDLFWQDSSYSREYNTPGDRIDAWWQHNASASIESADGRWAATAWIRNFTDKNNVRAHRVGSDAGGNFRTYWLTEPRIFGASIRYQFGAL
jgi:outer membrane receptor protein involved in Fe transport